MCLGVHSMCVGTESKYFNGHTNIADDKFLCFGVKGLMDTNRRLKDAMLFNILSYMSNAAGKRKYGGVGGRAVSLPDEPNRYRIYPQLHEAGAEEGLPL